MTLVEMHSITKGFPNVLANDHIDFKLRPGEIHGLLGENGAGKTTLMRILFGLYRPDEGQIWIRGEPVELRSPADAIALGIGMVHQHFRLIPTFTVTENIILGLPARGPFIDLTSSRQKVINVAAQYSLKVNPTIKVQQLSVGGQQRVEILNSLYRGAEVLILDEPTSVLTPQEADDLAVVLRSMASQGKAIVYITHKLDEVFKVTDRVTVLRAGKVVYSVMTHETNKNQLAREMIGYDINTLQLRQKDHVMALAGAEVAKSIAEERNIPGEDSGATSLKVNDLHVSDDRGLPAVKGISFEVHAGEILGIAGVDGNGQREMVEAIAGIRQADAGQLIVLGEDAIHWRPSDYIHHGIAYITDDRHGAGLVLNFDLERNSVLKVFGQEPFCKTSLLNFRAFTEFTLNIMKAFDVRAPNTHTQAGKLSGGNQQKLILGRELIEKPRLIIANKPTRGLDIRATAYIQQRFISERDRGAGILLITSDLDELLLLSDRILVMFAGEAMGVLPTSEADLQSLGLMMAGTRKSEIIA